MLKNFWNDEAGVIISAELVLVLTIAVLAMVVGLSEVAVAVNTELNDVSNAFGALNQSYCYTGFLSSCNGKLKGHIGGSSFTDAVDDCDVNTTCDLVTGSSTAGEGGNGHSRW
jgi:Flp pilus assembly pilin Flp